jgi:hypothetical protein
MESVTKDYYAMLQRVASDLESDDASVVLKNLEADRANLVIARNGISGAAAALRRHCERHHPKKLTERSFLALSISFSDSVLEQFWKGYHSFEDAGGASMGGGLILELMYLKKRDKDRAKGIDEQGGPLAKLTVEMVRHDAIDSIKTLEENWKEVSRRYAELKLFCGA